MFCVLDLADAYTQLRLDHASQDLMVFNTHKGLYGFKNLIYGVASAPSIFQNTMDIILHDIPKTCCYLDDVLIQGSNFEECLLSNVHKVLTRFNKFNVKLRAEKYTWFSESVEYLGHIISKHGRSPSTRLSDK